MNFEIQNDHRFHNFIVFDDTWLRIRDHEIIARGEEVYDIFFEAYHKFPTDEDDIKLQIIQHRLDKIALMLKQVKNWKIVIMTKFFDKVWKRYYTMSENGEYMLDMPWFNEILPQYSRDTLFADRIAAKLETAVDTEENSEQSEPVIKVVKNVDLNAELKVLKEEVFS